MQSRAHYCLDKNIDRVKEHINSGISLQSNNCQIRNVYKTEVINHKTVRYQFKLFRPKAPNSQNFLSTMLPEIEITEQILSAKQI